MASVRAGGRVRVRVRVRARVRVGLTATFRYASGSINAELRLHFVTYPDLDYRRNSR